MARQTCTVCAHPHLAAIDESLRNGTPSLRDLAAQCGLSKAALFRHKQHAKVAKDLTTKNIPEEIRKLKIMLNSAKRRRDTHAALSVSREIRAWMMLEAKTKPIRAKESGLADELSVGDALILAKAMIESQLQDPEVRGWLRSLIGQMEEETGGPQ